MVINNSFMDPLNKETLDEILELADGQNSVLLELLQSFFRDARVLVKLFESLADRYTESQGGSRRVVAAGFRYGDSAPMAVIELVDRDLEAKGYDDKLRVKELEESQDNISDGEVEKDQ